MHYDSQGAARYRTATARAALVCLALAAPSRFADAQDTGPAPDSATRPRVPSIWVSAGAGISMKEEASWLAGINYSPGIVLISIVAAGSDLLSGPGPGVEARAVMLGVRSHELNGLASASLGLARAHQSGGCYACGTPPPGPTATALAFSGAAHANRYGIGFALGMFGVVGPPGVRYVSFLLTLEAGWFGAPRLVVSRRLVGAGNTRWNGR